MPALKVSGSVSFYHHTRPLLKAPLTHSRFVRFVSFVCSHKINLDELILLCLFELVVIGSKSTLKSTLMPTHDGGVFSKERERVFIEGWAVMMMMILIIIASFKTRFKDTLLYSGRSSSYGDPMESPILKWGTYKSFYDQYLRFSNFLLIILTQAFY